MGGKRQQMQDNKKSGKNAPKGGQINNQTSKHHRNSTTGHSKEDNLQDNYTITEFSKLLLQSKELSSTFKSISPLRKRSQFLLFIKKEWKNIFSKVKIGRSNITLYFDRSGRTNPMVDTAKLDDGLIVAVGISDSNWKDRVPTLFGVELDLNYCMIRDRILSISEGKSLGVTTKSIRNLEGLKQLEEKYEEKCKTSISTRSENDSAEEFSQTITDNSTTSLNQRDGSIYDETKVSQDEDENENAKHEEEEEEKIDYSRYSFFNRLVFIYHGTSDYLINGADLMAPGISHYVDIQSVSDQKNAVAVALKKSKNKKGRSNNLWCLIFEMYSNHPVAVGAWIAGDNPNRGVAIEILHRYGDSIWNSCVYNGGIDPFTTKIEKVNEVDLNTNEKEESRVNKIETIKDQDAFLRQLFLSVLKSMPDSSFPLDAAIVYKQMLQHPLNSNSEANIKTSSWKKLAKFIKQMSKEKIVKAKSQNDCMCIHCVYRDHPDFASVQSAPEKVENVEKVEESAYLKLYSVPPELRFIIPNGVQDEAFTLGEISGIISKYLEKHREGGQIVLPPELLKLPSIKKMSKHIVDGKARIRDVKIAIEQCLKHVLGMRDENGVAILGKFEPLEIQVSQIMGRKLVTQVRNFKLYGIPYEHSTFLSQLQKIASASIKTNPGKGWELLIQGDAANQLVEYLRDEWGFNPKFAKIASTHKKKSK